MPSLHLTSMFGVRLGADGRVMYGVEYEDASGNGGRMLQWQPVLAWSDGATISAGLTEPTLLSRFLASLCDHSSFLHPCQADARERARRWGEAVVLSGGVDAPLKIGNQVMQGQVDTGLMVEAVTGIRKLPPHLFVSAQPRAAMAGGAPLLQPQTADIYVEVQRGGLYVCVCVCLCVFVCVCVRACACMLIYTHTHTHTHTYRCREAGCACGRSFLSATASCRSWLRHFCYRLSGLCPFT